MDYLKRITLDRLVKRGIESRNIQAFIRDLVNSNTLDENLTIQELNARMNFLGWSDVELDDHTLQLIAAVLETGEKFKEENFEL